MADTVEFGFPTDFSGKLEPVEIVENHRSARENKMTILKYISKETAKGATIGPFLQPLFGHGTLSPLGCVPKEKMQPDGEKRTIVDQSFGYAISEVAL